MMPHIKNADTDDSKIDNYCGITPSPLISMLFKLHVITCHKDYLKSNCLGSRKKWDAVYSEVEVELFQQNDSADMICALEISKTFNRVKQHFLF